jgi:hypothetical protein
MYVPCFGHKRCHLNFIYAVEFGIVLYILVVAFRNIQFYINLIFIC